MLRGDLRQLPGVNPEGQGSARDEEQLPDNPAPIRRDFEGDGQPPGRGGRIKRGASPPSSTPLFPKEGSVTPSTKFSIRLVGAVRKE